VVYSFYPLTFTQASRKSSLYGGLFLSQQGCAEAFSKKGELDPEAIIRNFQIVRTEGEVQ